jgi:hypothetical protein
MGRRLYPVSTSATTGHMSASSCPLNEPTNEDSIHWNVLLMQVATELRYREQTSQQLRIPWAQWYIASWSTQVYFFSIKTGALVRGSRIPGRSLGCTYTLRLTGRQAFQDEVGRWAANLWQPIHVRTSSPFYAQTSILQLMHRDKFTFILLPCYFVEKSVWSQPCTQHSFVIYYFGHASWKNKNSSCRSSFIL